MITFAKSKVDRFVHRNKALRYGQAFYQAFKLDKVTDAADKQFCNRIYEANEEKTKALIASRLDRNA